MLIRLSDSARLYHADCRDAIRSLPDNSIDSVVTDPPYALVSIVKRFGKPGSAPAKGNDAYMRASAGFMGKQWDTGEVAFSEDFWAEVLRVLKPGGHVAAFGASRGYHRMACAIEDAGFEIRDSIINVIDPESPVINFMQSLNDEQLGAFLRCLDDTEFGGTLAWMYGTGFPKSHDVSKGIDKAAGVDHLRAIISERKGVTKTFDIGATDVVKARDPVTAAYSDAARQWEGWGTALKPAFEPLVLARKPLSEGTVAANVLRWGTGALNIDGCRIHSEGSEAKAYTVKRLKPGATLNATGGNWRPDGDNTVEYQGMTKDGRWPANVVTDGSDAVVGAFPNLGKGSGVGRKPRERGSRPGGFGNVGHESGTDTPNGTVYTDSGSAARFFYSAKASRADRNGSKHPTVKPIALMQWLARLITPPGGTVLDPFAGSGTTGAAAEREGLRAVLIEREAEYVEDIKRRFGAGAPSLSLPASLTRLLHWNDAIRTRCVHV